MVPWGYLVAVLSGKQTGKTTMVITSMRWVVVIIHPSYNGRSHSPRLTMSSSAYSAVSRGFEANKHSGGRDCSHHNSGCVELPVLTRMS